MAGGSIIATTSCTSTPKHRSSSVDKCSELLCVTSPSSSLAAHSGGSILITPWLPLRTQQKDFRGLCDGSREHGSVASSALCAIGARRAGPLRSAAHHAALTAQRTAPSIASSRILKLSLSCLTLRHTSTRTTGIGFRRLKSNVHAQTSCCRLVEHSNAVGSCFISGG